MATKSNASSTNLVWCAGLLLAVLASPALGRPAAPKPAADPEQERVVLGALSYRIHCLNCHGGLGAGNGPMAELLKIAPADLTHLSAANDGEFPTERVYRAIDGRDAVRAHGSREMPVWGITFQEPGRDSAQEETVRDKILDLIAYLKTIQVDEETEEP